MLDGTFTDQVTPDSRALKVKDNKEGKKRKSHKRVDYPAAIRRYIIVGSKSWSERYLVYEWNGHECGSKRRCHCPKPWTRWRRDERYDETSSSLCLITKSQKDACQMWFNHHLDMSSYTITPWMRTCTRNGWMRSEPRRISNIHKDDNERRRWECLSDGKNEEEMESWNLMIDESGEFNEVTKKHILYGKHDYSQCFIIIIAYNLMWTQDGELKILNLTDDRLGYLRVIHKDHIDD